MKTILINFANKFHHLNEVILLIIDTPTRVSEYKQTFKLTAFRRDYPPKVGYSLIRLPIAKTSSRSEPHSISDADNVIRL